MKLYRKIKKRIAKKLIGSYDWPKLECASKLKPGDLISNCIGYNEVIKTIKPQYFRGRFKNRVICDFSVVSESGLNCSVTHCCTFPLETKEQIEHYWLRMEEGKDNLNSWYNRSKFARLVIRELKSNNEVFDSNGCLSSKFIDKIENE